MKKIEAVIFPSKFNDVKDALERVGIEGFSVLEVYSLECQKTLEKAPQAGPYVGEYERQLKIETVVVDYKAIQVCEAIRKAARTGHAYERAILILPVEEVLSIRTGEHGHGALNLRS